ncbi:hypothetical protein [Loigolactobacillus zhaoyuanensis]|uniref:Integral membrane protein n=1 Tax=Loigolactobacillus zhaoyuanensis TaxID=2486017 RepID=A0ABW8UBH7_9LACO|nr:hypothetical protein [Loigolactobacillus zhaoyuanensis]
MKKWRFYNYLLAFIIISMVLSLSFTVVAVSTVPVTGRSKQLFLLLEIVLGIGILLLPQLVARLGHFKLPEILYILFLLFIYGSVYLGTVYQFYSRVPHWDKILHVGSAMLLGCLGYALIGIFVRGKQLTQLSPVFMAIFAFTFGLSIGVFWEFYEFAFDGLLGLNMQRFMAHGVLLRGRAALIDTMGDLFADALGTFAVALLGYMGIHRDVHWLDKFMFHKIAPKK